MARRARRGPLGAVLFQPVTWTGVSAANPPGVSRAGYSDGQDARREAGETPALRYDSAASKGQRSKIDRRMTNHRAQSRRFPLTSTSERARQEVEDALAADPSESDAGAD